MPGQRIRRANYGMRRDFELTMISKPFSPFKSDVRLKTVSRAILVDGCLCPIHFIHIMYL